MTVQSIVSKDQFDTLVGSGKVIFIDFYADWCGPCKQISPVFKKLAEENAKDGVEFYQLNVDHVPDVAEAVSIRAMPTFHAYKNKERLNVSVGANPTTLRNLVQTSLSN